MIRYTTIRHIVLWTACFFLIFPVVVAISVALSPEETISPTIFGILPSRISWDNIRTIGHSGKVGTCFLNSLTIALSSALFGICLGFPAAYVLARHDLRWKGVILTVLLLLRLQPKMPAMAAYYHMVTVLGLLNTHASIVLVRGGGILLAIWLMKAAVQSVPISLEQSALLDGFSPWRVATRVTLPLCLPSIGAAFLLEFASAWNSFLLPLLFLSSENRMTVALGIDRFLSGYAIQPGLVMAFTVVVSLPLVLIFPWLLIASLTPYKNRILER